MNRRLTVVVLIFLAITCCFDSHAAERLPADGGDRSVRYAIGSVTVDTISGTPGKPMELPIPLEQEDIAYPDEAINKSIEGDVHVKLHVTSNGKVDLATILIGADPILDSVAVDAARRAKFQPATQDGKSIAVWCEVTYIFKLDLANSAAWAKSGMAGWDSSWSEFRIRCTISGGLSVPMIGNYASSNSGADGSEIGICASGRAFFDLPSGAEFGINLDFFGNGQSAPPGYGTSLPSWDNLFVGASAGYAIRAHGGTHYFFYGELGTLTTSPPSVGEAQPGVSSGSPSDVTVLGLGVGVGVILPPSKVTIVAELITAGLRGSERFNVPGLGPIDQAAGHLLLRLGYTI